MRGYVFGTFVKPKMKRRLHESKQISNSKIIHNYILTIICIQLVKYDTFKEVWDDPKRLYAHSDIVKQINIFRTLQQNMRIYKLYSAMFQSLGSVALTESAKLQAFKLHIDCIEQHLVQFVMAF
jgi:hypothetical protein